MPSFPQSPLTNSSMPDGENDPVFHAPWEAHAFAIVHQLAAAQHYSWAEWTEQLATIIREAEQQAPGEKSYYELWVNACETLLMAKGVLNADAVEQKMADILAQKESEHHH